jgi:predicted metalloprotease with PDZ domain
MSKGVLDEYKDEYANVYEKGALIGMCLDLKLRILSGGSYGIQNLMTDLSKTYGRNTSFKDDELFAEIEKLTFPEIGDFLNRYVGGPEPLPYKEMLAAAGIAYSEQKSEKGFSLGNVPFSFNPETGRLVVLSTKNLNEFGREIGYREGDELFSFNGTELRPQNIQKVFDDFFSTVKEGDKLTIVVMRTVKGKEKKKKLKAKVAMTTKYIPNALDPVETATPAQLELRKAWLGDYSVE